MNEDGNVMPRRVLRRDRERAQHSCLPKYLFSHQRARFLPPMGVNSRRQEYPAVTLSAPGPVSLTVYWNGRVDTDLVRRNEGFIKKHPF
ncbi:hypothetical protein J6590_047811 [Homalodisca vitripennis]|nr:hypothetical protein J6590_047811 [Homalodisca vitripennis]